MSRFKAALTRKTDGEIIQALRHAVAQTSLQWKQARPKMVEILMERVREEPGVLEVEKLAIADNYIDARIRLVFKTAAHKLGEVYEARRREELAAVNNHPLFGFV